MNEHIVKIFDEEMDKVVNEMARKPMPVNKEKKLQPINVERTARYIERRIDRKIAELDNDTKTYLKFQLEIDRKHNLPKYEEQGDTKEQIRKILEKKYQDQGWHSMTWALNGANGNTIIILNKETPKK